MVVYRTTSSIVYENKHLSIAVRLILHRSASTSAVDIMPADNMASFNVDCIQVKENSGLSNG